MRKLFALVALISACSPVKNDNPDPSGTSASLVRDAAPVLDTTGLRCVLHSSKGAASVDSCAAVTVAVVPPAPPPAPPPPAPVPPPTPPPVSGSCLRTVNTSTTSALTSAVASAVAGDCILLAAGTYTLPGSITFAKSGTASAPITVQGVGSATIIDAARHPISITASYMHLRKLRLTNFTTVGMWVSGATSDVLDSIEVDHTQQEALAFKSGTNHTILENSLIHDTGIANGQYGEGIYVSSSGENAPLDYTVTDNQILNNHFGPNVRAEAIDLKEGADRTVIRGNYIDGTGAFYYSGTGTLVAIKSNNVVVDSNYFQVGMYQAVAFEAPVKLPMQGNVASRNKIDLRNAQGYGFQFQAGTVNPMGAVIKCDNVMVSGNLSNRPCTP